MKISVDIECTPAEARAFFGLPDLTPLHDAYLERLKGAMTDGFTPADWERLTRAWMPGVADGLEQWQKLFQTAIAKSGGS